MSSTWKNSADLLAKDNSTNHHVQARFLDAPGDRLGRHNFCRGKLENILYSSNVELFQKVLNSLVLQRSMYFTIVLRL